MIEKSFDKLKTSKNILWFSEISITDVPLVGGKNASLGEMYSKLTSKGVSVPNGFALTASAYWKFLEASGLKNKIKQELKGLNINDVRDLARRGEKIRKIILEAKFPKEIEKDLLENYQRLSVETKTPTTPPRLIGGHPSSGRRGQPISVAVRSSATAEDLPDASFAGQQETYLNIVGDKELLLAVKKCVASLFTNRAISYRETKGFDHLQVALSVTVQQMVRSDLGSAGVMFTLDTESGFKGVVLINSAYGLGEYVVKGRVTPDQFYIFKEGVKQGKSAIFSKILGTKDVKLIYGKKAGTTQAKVNKSDRDQFSIKDKDVIQLSKWGMQIEEHYGRSQDIEWAKDGQTGKLYIVQARPETVKAQVDHSFIETYVLKPVSAKATAGKLLLTGIAVGQKIGAGKVRIIDNPKNMKLFKKGEVLVTRITDPDWEPIMRLASAIVTEQGGKTSHAAIVSRELGVPCLVGAREARKVLKTGQPVTVCCAEGDEGHIYKDILPFEVKKTEIKTNIQTKTKIMMNVGDPGNAFPLSFIPNDGIGLAREEFIFTNFIRIHPLALIHYHKLKDKVAKKKIAEMTRGYKNKEQYCIDKLAEGIARIAVASYKNDVIVRLSDFKTNEYATLIGGKEFEPKEENPMIGWRGASRYYSKEYKEGFRLECEALKKVRNDWGLTNVIIMVPFCRTPEEGELVLKTMEEFGLKRGENGLQVYVMCEIPSNVILAEEFAKIFDGFSIGSNDLTQLTLGVDRDSALVAHVYSEKNKAVVTLIRDVIRTAHKYKRKVGICGQAPSDYPEFAEMLVREGIDSISLNPDTVVSTRERIAMVEKTLGKVGKKTSAKYLSLLVVVGLVAVGFISLGAGCARMDFERLEQNTLPQKETVTPAQIREKVEENTQAKFESLMLPLKESSFANFNLEYPFGWTIEHGSNTLVLRDEKTGDYFYISSNGTRTSEKMSAESLTTSTIGGRPVVSYRDALAEELGGEFMAVEIGEGNNTLFVRGKGERFEAILQTLKF